MKNKSKINRLLALDYGTKRVGVAVSDESNSFALPVLVLKNNAELIPEIEKLAKEYEVEGIIVGESRDYKGKPNTIFPAVEKLKKELETLGYKVTLEPEYMTSAQAERLQGKNEMLDASAAAIILQSYLDKK